jgi:hypothetical protein
VRALAHYNNILVKNRQDQSSYQKLIDRVNFIEIKDKFFKTNKYCRTGFAEPDYEDFKAAYE